MGTRHLIGIKNEKGDWKLANYSQWDGYPSGNGLNMLGFCSVKDNLEKLENKLALLRFFDYEDEKDKDYIERFNNSETRTKDMKEKYDTFNNRDLSVHVLYNILEEDNEIVLQDDSGFMESVVFNEYSYIINFQTRKLECYISCKLAREYDLDKLPSKKQFLKELGEGGEDLI